ncbi:MAG: hypothetical protein ACXVA3_02050 [Vulcanimicrobiaceae bacterium]
MWRVSGRRSGQRFDAENGVTTEALLFLGELDPETIGDAIADATHYEPVPVADFHALLGAISEHLDGFTFVDAGAGMGRAMMLASLYPFKQIVGVEVSRALCEIATANLAAWRRREGLRCNDFRVVNADAAAFTYPPGNLVAFLYNPFGAVTLARTIERVLETRTPQDWLYIVYHTPEERLAVEGDAGFELVSEMKAGRVYRRRRS